MSRHVLLCLIGLLAACSNPIPTVRSPQASNAQNCLYFDRERDPGASSCESAALPPGGSFDIDISGLVGKLAAQSKDERPEQIADWAIFGTFIHARLPQPVLQGVTFDRAPIRMRALEDVSSTESGPGRHAILPDGTAWVVYEGDDPHPEATLARHADQVRVELGRVPAFVRVFSYQSDLDRAAIKVHRNGDISGAQLFSARYGYREARVVSREDLAQFIGEIDDLTHARLLDGGVVEFGGRRHPRARTANVNLEDLATLYQAYRNVDKSARDRAMKRMPPGLAESLKGQPQLLDLLLRMRQGKASVGFSLDPQWDADGFVADLRQLAQDPRPLVARALEAVRSSKLRGDREDALPFAVRRARSLADHFKSAELAQFQVAEPWRSQLSAVVSSLQGKRGLETERAGLAFERLRADAHQERRRIAETVETLTRQLSALRAGGSEASLAAQRQSIIERISALSGQQHAAFDLLLVLNYLEAEHHHQCARYDGDLKGTHVGMVLFYADLLAKVWASTDYYHSAPVCQVPGLRTEPRVGPTIEPAFWEEIKNLNGTRVWFAPRTEAFSVSSSGKEVQFGHLMTRVYAAGSTAVAPDQESTANEESRQVIGWWDRHYGRIAAYEPQLHIQNQILKWSVLAGWLAEQGRLRFLDQEQVNRSLRFDQWIAANKKLKFNRDVRFLPPERWPEGTECMEQLTSYTYAGAGVSAFIAGGVSLGKADAVAKAPRVPAKLPVERLRAGLSADSSSDVVRTLRGGTFRLGQAPDGGALTEARAASPQASIGRVRQVQTALSTRDDAGALAQKSERGSLTHLRFERKANLVVLDSGQAPPPGSPAQALRAALDKAGDGDITKAVDRFVSAHGGVEAQGQLINDLAGSPATRPLADHLRARAAGDTGARILKRGFRLSTERELPAGRRDVLIQGHEPKPLLASARERSQASERAAQGEDLEVYVLSDDRHVYASADPGEVASGSLRGKGLKKTHARLPDLDSEDKSQLLKDPRNHVEKVVVSGEPDVLRTEEASYRRAGPSRPGRGGGFIPPTGGLSRTSDGSDSGGLLGSAALPLCQAGESCIEEARRGEALSSGRDFVRTGRRRTVYLVRPSRHTDECADNDPVRALCDKNGDGEISREESALCYCDRDRNGTLSAEEARCAQP